MTGEIDERQVSFFIAYDTHPSSYTIGIGWYFPTTMWRYLSRGVTALEKKNCFVCRTTEILLLILLSKNRSGILFFFNEKMIIWKWNFSFLVVPSKRTFTKKSGGVTSNIDKRYNPINQEEQDSSSSSDDLKTMTEVCHEIYHIYKSISTCR